MSISIKYKDNIVVTADSGDNIITIHCANKKFNEDLVIESMASGSGGSAEFNIAYGDTEPTDTSKLWVKTSEPSAVQVTSKLVVASEELDFGIGALPKAAYGIASAVVGTKVYLFGGEYSGTTINVFDTEANVLTTLETTLPVSRSYMASAAIGTKVYLFGGSISKTIFVFDTETNTIEQLSATLPTAASYIASAVVGTKVYLFGGFNRSGTSAKLLTTINVFDAETNTVSTLSLQLPAKTQQISAATVGTKIYLFGGATSITSSSQIDLIRVFDTETHVLTTLETTLPTAAGSIAAAAIGTKVYLFGGGSYGTRLDTINVFDAETNTVSTLDASLSAAESYIASAVVGNSVYLFGGDAGFALNTINAFVAKLALASNNMLIEAAKAENLFNLLSNVEIGVKNVYLGNANGVAEKVPAYLNRVKSGIDYENYYTSSAAETTSGTELTSSVECNVGDLVVAAIATRDTLTLSDGWTLISTSEVNSTDESAQRLSWAWKFAESTTESITVTQATEQRLYINMVALQGATGVTDNGYSYRDDTTSGDLTVNKPSGLVLWGMTSTLWGTSAPYPIWTSSNDMPIVQLDISTQSRLGIGLDQSDDESVTLMSGSDASTIIVGCLTVQGMDKFYTATPWTREVWEEI